MRRAIRVRLTDAEERQLGLWSDDAERDAPRARRARIVLHAAHGDTNREIAKELGVDPGTVALWRRRFIANRLEGIRMEAPRSGRRHGSGWLQQRILSATGTEPASESRAWTTRALAKRLRVSHMTVYRAWRASAQGQTHPAARAPAARAYAPKEALEIEGIFLQPPRRAAVLQVDDAATHWTAASSTVELREVNNELGAPPADRFSALLRQWKRPTVHRPESESSVADLLVFLRSVERRGPVSGSFVVLYDGLSRAAEGRVNRWIGAHPRFRPARVPAGSNWVRAVEESLREAPASPAGSSWERVAVPLTDSLASYLRAHPAPPAPFIWTPPELGDDPSPLPTPS